MVFILRGSFDYNIIYCLFFLGKKMEENRVQVINVLLLSMGEVDDGISYWYLLLLIELECREKDSNQNHISMLLQLHNNIMVL